VLVAQLVPNTNIIHYKLYTIIDFCVHN